MKCVMAVIAGDLYLVEDGERGQWGWIVDLKMGRVDKVRVDTAIRQGTWIDPGSDVDDATMKVVEDRITKWEEEHPNAPRS